MAAKKTAGKTANVVTYSDQTLMHGREAYGAQFIREGFAITTERDLEFALGWPSMLRLVEGHADDQAAEKNAIATMYADLPRTLPREVACRQARFHAAGGEGVEGGKATPKPAAAAMKKAGPPSADEARARIRDDATFDGAELRVIYLMEALHGPDLVVEAALDGLSERTLDSWANDHGAHPWLRMLGFTLLRASKSAAAKARDRLEAIYQDCVKTHFGGTLPALAKPRSVSANVRALDLVLHGSEGARRSAKRYEDGGKTYSTPADVMFVHDDPELVRSFVRETPADHDSPELGARHVFLGGPEVLDMLAERWPRMRPDYQVRLASELAAIADDRAYEILVRMSATSKAKKEALAALIANAARSRPFVEKLAGGRGDVATFAKAVLPKLTG